MRGFVARFGALLLVAALLVAGLVGYRASREEPRTLTATFPSTTSLYEGARVKVLGVAVGTVDRIRVRGTSVEVTMTYDADVRLPADVHALVVPPSIVGDRFVQLAPVWKKGTPVLEDDARLDLTRTAVPLELDDVYRELNDLSTALGPEGANQDGALSRLIAASAESLDGNGRLLNETIRQLAGALDTLATSQGDYQGTVTNTNQIVRTLAGNDAAIEALVRNLAQVGTQLNGQRDDLGRAVEDLASALETVAAFTRANRGELTTTIKDLGAVAGQLARHKAELEEITDLAPVGLTNLINIYEPRNWDPSKPWLTPPAGRAGSASLRSALFNDLDVQLAFALSAFCANLPAPQAAQLAGFCQGLASVGGDLGALLMQLIEQGQTPPTRTTPGAESLAGLLLGGTR